jgi:uncharacterized protein YjbJ (UPF0337 family)
MLRGRQLVNAAVGIGDKVVGLMMEAAGTFTGSDRLKDAGRVREEAGDERLTALEEEVKAGARKARAVAGERRQQAFQDPSDRSTRSRIGEDASAGHGAAERAKGTVKQAVGAVAGQDDLRREGEAQKAKGRDETQAAKHEAKADVHDKEADIAKAASERMRKS